MISNEIKIIPNTPNILIVDDIPDNLKVLGAILKESGYKIRPVTSGMLALQVAEKEKPDMILLDVMMPDMDGYEVCRRLKENKNLSDVPVIFITALNATNDIKKSFQAGGVDYITKPFKKEELLARVNSHIQLAHIRNELKENSIKLSESLKRSDELLLNVLPKDVAEDFKNKGTSLPQAYNDVTLFVSDFIKFTEISSMMEPIKLFDELNEMYSVFDNIMKKNNCERIKTIGDAYLAVCGMPVSNPDHAENILNAAFEIKNYINNRKENNKIKWEIRIGIHTGNVIGGVVGIEKYIYDVFGDSVNTVFRMETASDTMQINISETTYKLLKNKFTFIERPYIDVKGLGQMKMYFVKS